MIFLKGNNEQQLGILSIISILHKLMPHHQLKKKTIYLYWYILLILFFKCHKQLGFYLLTKKMCSLLRILIF